MVFDDVHMSMQDAVFVRDSATRFFTALAPSDRVSINTTSGQFTQDFTDDHALLEKALFDADEHRQVAEVVANDDVDYRQRLRSRSTRERECPDQQGTDGDGEVPLVLRSLHGISSY